MTTTLTAPATALAVLYGRDDATAPLTSGLERGPVLRQAMTGLPAVSHMARHAIAAECARIVSPVLRIDVGAVALSGWRAHEDLVAAARETADKPGTTAVVVLRHHRMSAERRPRLDVLVDGRPTVSLWFPLAFDFDVAELAATVEGGRLVALRSGDTDMKVTLSTALRPDAKGVKLAEQHAKLEVPLVVSLGQGIPLQRQPPQVADDSSRTRITSAEI
jgi:hypothetical protein